MERNMTCMLVLAGVVVIGVPLWIVLAAWCYTLKGKGRKIQWLKKLNFTALRTVSRFLATCIVQTLNESDPTFTARFLDRLSRAYHELKDNSEGDVIQEMELLSWTRTCLTGFNHVTGQGKPFLED
jgi:hypothetical protein